MQKKYKVLVFGAGYLGSQIDAELNKNADIASYIVKTHIYRPEDILTAIKDIESKNPDDNTKIGLIINAIGKTGTPNVDWCEDHKEETYFSNVEVPRLLGYTARALGIPMIHVSSGCIFNGEGPFSITDSPNFSKSYYSYTKMYAELQMIDDAYRSHTFENTWNGMNALVIHRIRMPFDGTPSPRNLLTKVMNYDTLVDAKNSMTYMDDYLAFVVREVTMLLEMKPDSVNQILIRHAVNPGALTHREILGMIEEMESDKIKLKEKRFVKPEELDAMTRTPRSNCVLATDDLGFLDINTAMREAISKYFSSMMTLEEEFGVAKGDK